MDAFSYDMFGEAIESHFTDGIPVPDHTQTIPSDEYNYELEMDDRAWLDMPGNVHSMSDNYVQYEDPGHGQVWDFNSNALLAPESTLVETPAAIHSMGNSTFDYGGFDDSSVWKYDFNNFLAQDPTSANLAVGAAPGPVHISYEPPQQMGGEMESISTNALDQVFLTASATTTNHSMVRGANLDTETACNADESG